MLEPEQLLSKYWSGSDHSRGINKFRNIFVSVESIKFINAPQLTRVLKTFWPRSGICVVIRKDWEDWEEIGVLERLQKDWGEEEMVAACVSMGIASLLQLKVPPKVPELLPHLTLCVGCPHPLQLLPQLHKLLENLPLPLPKWRQLILLLVNWGMLHCNDLVFHISSKGCPDSIILALHY